jgi:hypothetical protein
MNRLYYTETRKITEGENAGETEVYVPDLDEWMTENEFYAQKRMYDDAYRDAETYWAEHGSDF